jgi:epoxide hydrolase-like predicted phosphatase
LFAKLPRDGGLRQELVDKVGELKAAGIPMAIITNNIREFSEGWRSLFAVDELFAEVIDSSFEGVRKPDPAIFELALERMGAVKPAEALFLDDHPANVAAAEALGMQAILVGNDLAQVILEIDRHMDAV